MNVSHSKGKEASGVTVAVEPELGARCTSIRSAAGREWLANRSQLNEARAAVRPGDPFVDAGGLEECFPTIAGAFDHGDVWSKPWRAHGDSAAIDGDEYHLERTTTVRDAGVTFSYRLAAEPGFPFVWAGHASVDLSNDAKIVAPAGTRTRLWPDHWRTYPEVEQVEGPWPSPLGRPLDGVREDGTAVFLMLLDVRELSLIDGGDRLTFRLEVEDQPIAIAVWRNLGRWPEHDPYRSIAIEPAIGQHFDRDLAGEGEVGLVPASGIVEWRLIVSLEDGDGHAEASPD